MLKLLSRRRSGIIDVNGLRFCSSSSVAKTCMDRLRDPHSNFSGLEMSKTLHLNEMQNLLQYSGRDIYKFGFGQSPFPVPECMVDLLRDNAKEKSYLPVQGLLTLREAISQHFNKKHGDAIPISPQNVMITPGTKQALFLIQLALSQSCQILLPSPSWVSYQPQSQIIGKGQNVDWIETNYKTKWKINITQFEEKYLKKDGINKQRLLVLNSPSNPTGVQYTNDELHELSQICRKYNIIVVADEIYGDLYHDEVNGCYNSLYDYYPEGTIILNGLSKNVGAGGWRIGYCIFPPQFEWLLKSVYIASSETFTSVSAPIQYASIAAFEQFEKDGIRNYLKLKRKILGALANKSYNLLSSIDGCNVIKPDGAFYIFPDFSKVKNIDKMRKRWCKDTGNHESEWNASEFSLDLLNESGVAGLAGNNFGRPLDELSLRLAYVDFCGEDVVNNIDVDRFCDLDFNSKEMDEYLNKFCPQTVKGMSVLADYFNSL